MNEARTWVRWWAFAWHHAHPDWEGDFLATLPTRQRQKIALNHHVAASKCFNISPCLPCHPSAALCQLVFAKPGQHELTLAIAHAICRPAQPTGLDSVQTLWCQRLAKALRPSNWLDDDDDVLQLLRAWVEPAVWQRMRLRYSKKRVITLEKKAVFSIPLVKLETLWQAALWQAHTLAPAPLLPYEQVHHDAVTPQDCTAH